MAEESVTSANAVRPIRVLTVLPALGTSGTEAQVINLVRHMDRSCFNPQFACLRRSGPLLEETERMGLAVSEFPISSLRRLHTFKRLLEFAAFLRSQDIQLVHSYTYYGNVFAIPAARLAGVEVTIASIRDQGVYLRESQKHLQKWVCRLADRILVNAGSIRDWLLAQGYAERRITVVPNGIDLGSYQPSSATSSLRRELGIPVDNKMVVMISRINHEKGIDDFIDAAGIIAAKNPNVAFLVVGTAWREIDGVFVEDDRYLAELRSRADKLGLNGALFFTGFRNDIPQILSDTAVSVLPSLSEGSPNTLLESMAAGVPIVTTRVGGSPELLDGGKCGLLVPPAVPRALADAIELMLENPRLARAFGDEAKQRARARFSMERMVDDIQHIYFEELART